MTPPSGLVVAAFGRHYLVELAGNTIRCVTRSKRSDFACGDQVELVSTGAGSGVIERALPRSSLLYRSNAYRSKLLAANVTQAVFVLAVVPAYYEELLHRGLVAAEAAGIGALIVLNKQDLPGTAAVAAQLEFCRALGVPVLPLSARDDVTPLRPWLHGKSSVLVGQSGMGKSTIINALFGSSHVRTQEISKALDSGKHTTTATRLYHLDAQSQLIDSPGLQEFGLNHLTPEQLEYAFVEFRPFLGHCRFNNCRHGQEPDCAVSGAVAAGIIPPGRWRTYRKVLAEIMP